MKNKIEMLIDSFRVILMDEDTECGNEILCTLIAKKCAYKAAEILLSDKEYKELFVVPFEEKYGKFLNYIDSLNINELNDFINGHEDYLFIPKNNEYGLKMLNYILNRKEVLKKENKKYGK